MYYGSGTVDRNASGQPVDAAGCSIWSSKRPADGSCTLTR